MTNVEAILQKAISNLPNKVQLIELSHDMELDNEQLEQMIKGEDFDRLIDDFSIIEERMSAINYLMQECLSNEDEREALYFDDTYYQQFVEACEERDTSDPIKDMLDNTRLKPWRINVGFSTDGSSNPTEEKTNSVIASMADALGLDLNTPGLEQALRDIWDNNYYYGGQLCLLVFIKPRDMFNIVQEAQKGKIVELKISGCDILLYDGIMGSGYDAWIDQEITVELDSKKIANGVFLDQGRMSWTDDIAGRTIGPETRMTTNEFYRLKIMETITTIRKVMVEVEADDLEQAKNLAVIGETVSEHPISTKQEVVGRDIVED